MGLRLTKHRTTSCEIQRDNKAYSDDQLVRKRRWVLGPVYPLKIANFARRHPIGATSGPKGPPTGVSKEHRRPPEDGSRDALEGLGSLPVKTPHRAKSAKVKSRTWCISDVNNDLRVRTYTKLTCAESTCTLETEEQGLAVNRAKSEDDDDDDDDNDDAKNRDDILQRTVAFLSYELEPVFLEKFCNNSKRVTDAEEEKEEEEGEEKKRVQIEQRSSVSKTVDSIRKILAPIVRDPDSDEYREFCEALREQAHDHYLADFLEALGSLLKLKEEEKEEEDDGEKQSQCLCRLQSTVTDSSSSSSSCRLFELDVIYVDRETRKAKSFNGVTSLKRRRYRRSHPDAAAEDHVTAVRVGDASDRYVPMLSVRLYAQCLCEGRARRLQRVVEAYPCVRDLSLVRTRLEDQAKVRLCRAIEQNVGLYALDLNLSCLGDDGAMFLASALRSNRDLRSLNLSTNDLTDHGCGLLARGLARSRALTELNLGFNDVGDGGCEALAAVLAGNRCHLRRLKLRNNNVTARGASAIFGSLRKNSRLCHLDLGSNDITDEALRSLSDALIHNRTLSELCVDNCGITRRGCHVIARPLKVNTVLRCLSLSMNGVGDAGVQRLAEGVKHNRSLVELSLNMCEISNSGLWHLLEAVRHNFRLKTLKLCYNSIDINAAARTVRNGGGGATGIRRDVISGGVSSSTKRDRRSFPVDANYFDGDDTSADDVSGSELYARLVELLHANSPLKVILWGNRLEDSNQRMSVATSSQDSIDYL